jgi:hypothetical protein
MILKLILRETRFDDYEWIHLAQDRGFLLSCGHNKNFGFHKMRKRFWTTVQLLDSQQKFYGMNLNENVFSILNLTFLWLNCTDWADIRNKLFHKN